MSNGEICSSLSNLPELTFANPDPSVREATGADVLAVAQDRGLEGVVLKRLNARYAARRPKRATGSRSRISKPKRSSLAAGPTGKGSAREVSGRFLLGIPTKTGFVTSAKSVPDSPAESCGDDSGPYVPLNQDHTPFIRALAADRDGGRTLRAAGTRR